MKYLEWILHIFAALGLSAQQQFTADPPDLSSSTGGNIVLPCEANTGTDYFEWWEVVSSHTGEKVYSSRSPNQILYKPEKFDVNGTKPQTGAGSHNLIIKNVELKDGGSYSARITTIAGMKRDAEVVILEEPEIEPPAASALVDNTTRTFVCKGNYGGPMRANLKDSHRPALEFTINSFPVPVRPEDDKITEGSPGKTAHQLEKKGAVTITADHHGQMMVCSISTTDPAYIHKRERKLDVLFSVRDIRITPRVTGGQLTVSSDEHLNCTASGNPEPNIRWVPVTVPSPPPGATPPIARDGFQLQMGPEMIGENEWRCEARNTVPGRDVTIVTATIQFTVVAATGSPITDGASVPLPILPSLLLFLLSLLLALC